MIFYRIILRLSTAFITIFSNLFLLLYKDAQKNGIYHALSYSFPDTALAHNIFSLYNNIYT